MIENTLKSLLAELKKECVSIKNELRGYPQGDLMIYKSTAGTQFFCVTRVDGARIRKGISTDTGLVYKLARKAYLQRVLSRIEHNVDLIEGIMKKCQDIDDADLLKNLPKNYELLRPDWILHPDLINNNANKPHPVGDGTVNPIELALTLDEMMKMAYPLLKNKTNPSEWYSMGYCANNSFIQYKTHIADNGLRVRSKSEASIIGLYNTKNIPYHYDEQFTIGGISISPDIVAVRNDGSVFIHEHAGLWTSDYLERNNRKMQLYKSAGFIQGRNLLITYDDENGNINLKLISALIDDMYHA